MPERWYWDPEGDPRHVGCEGEMTFFQTLADEEVGMCLTCCSTDFRYRPDSDHSDGKEGT